MTLEFRNQRLNAEATVDEFAKAVGIDLRDLSQADLEQDDAEQLNDDLVSVKDEPSPEGILAIADPWSYLHRAA